MLTLSARAGSNKISSGVDGSTSEIINSYLPDEIFIDPRSGVLQNYGIYAHT